MNIKKLKRPITNLINNRSGELDSVDIVSHFKIRADYVLQALGELEEDGVILRTSIGLGSSYAIKQMRNDNLKEGDSIEFDESKDRYKIVKLFAGGYVDMVKLNPVEHEQKMFFSVQIQKFKIL